MAGMRRTQPLPPLPNAQANGPPEDASSEQRQNSRHPPNPGNKCPGVFIALSPQRLGSVTQLYVLVGYNVVVVVAIV